MPVPADAIDVYGCRTAQLILQRQVQHAHTMSASINNQTQLMRSCLHAGDARVPGQCGQPADRDASGGARP
jgi:hypothetical protein